MKIQLVKRGGKYFLRKYFLGFIPLYWDNGYEGGWGFIKLPMNEDDAITLMSRWMNEATRKKHYKSSPEVVLNTIKI